MVQQAAHSISTLQHCIKLLGQAFVNHNLNASYCSCTQPKFRAAARTTQLVMHWTKRKLQSALHCWKDWGSLLKPSIPSVKLFNTDKQVNTFFKPSSYKLFKSKNSWFLFYIAMIERFPLTLKLNFKPLSSSLNSVKVLILTLKNKTSQKFLQGLS